MLISGISRFFLPTDVSFVAPRFKRDVIFLGNAALLQTLSECPATKGVRESLLDLPHVAGEDVTIYFMLPAVDGKVVGDIARWLANTDLINISYAVEYLPAASVDAALGGRSKDTGIGEMLILNKDEGKWNSGSSEGFEFGKFLERCRMAARKIQYPN
ncbi:MAG: hypothetical protein OXR68_06630 [Alphaproteobacteria bacterium]|nr:hypothetical protein [Alphaproteobacteria bacterium]MDD9920279.1 hypothetical protein [Alphaproteobacteria bacterium]